MHITTMAVQITEKTWPVAVACLGGSFASRPFPEVEGSFLVINTPDRQDRFRRVRQFGGPSAREGILLDNAWESEEDFLEMYQYDGRKNLETFFEVKKIAERPPFKATKTDVRQQLLALADQMEDEDDQDQS